MSSFPVLLDHAHFRGVDLMTSEAAQNEEKIQSSQYGPKVPSSLQRRVWYGIHRDWYISKVAILGFLSLRKNLQLHVSHQENQNIWSPEMRKNLEAITKDKSIYGLRKSFPKFPLQTQVNKIDAKLLINII